MSNKLSTSNVGGGFDGTPHFSVPNHLIPHAAGVKSFGFGAVHAEGVGLGYMINDDSLPLTLTSYTGHYPSLLPYPLSTDTLRCC